MTICDKPVRTCAIHAFIMPAALVAADLCSEIGSSSDCIARVKATRAVAITYSYAKVAIVVVVASCFSLDALVSFGICVWIRKFHLLVNNTVLCRELFTPHCYPTLKRSLQI